MEKYVTGNVTNRRQSTERDNVVEEPKQRSTQESNYKRKSEEDARDEIRITRQDTEKDKEVTNADKQKTDESKQEQTRSKPSDHGQKSRSSSGDKTTKDARPRRDSEKGIQKPSTSNFSIDKK